MVDHQLVSWLCELQLDLLHLGGQELMAQHLWGLPTFLAIGTLLRGLLQGFDLGASPGKLLYCLRLRCWDGSPLGLKRGLLWCFIRCASLKICVLYGLGPVRNVHRRCTWDRFGDSGVLRLGDLSAAMGPKP